MMSLTLQVMEATVMYKEYKLENICGTNMVKQSLYLNNWPAIFTFNSTTNIRLRCHLELHLFAADFGFSVFTEALKLDDTPQCFTDYVQFGRQVSPLLIVQICNTISGILFS